ncbi:hypothetical protein S40285_02855 [Stachybotrys chlorohalonatus IBT 40285]|uniref:AB hydrolase-1 domain-containing protein n=1 Tax=Stachybotrys chlorohalonatus (strain IBT 40285) TaxID=1283841 RepID=A0A084QLR0_STAC4|nr:hypothetical protein S40285_02855 [Stachybotrys chlorohalonata IBT 40285]
MFDGFESFSITTQQDPPISISGIKSSNDACLPALLLLHGFPQTRHIWHLVAPRLTSKYTVVVPDLRGYGASSKPPELVAYAKSAMAHDFIVVMDQLGFEGKDFYVCGHDRGARVAHKLCVDHPRRVRKVMLLDISPTLAMFEATNEEFAKLYYHWFFLAQPEPLPETFLSARPREFIELFMGGAKKNLGLFEQRCMEEYVKAAEDPAAVHAMCNDYRAAASLDLDEARQDLKNGRLIQCPVRVLWGKQGVIERCFKAVEDWRAVTAEGVPVHGSAVDSGHYIPEQVPDDVVSNILDFFV